MILCQFEDTTDASDIYNSRPISGYIIRAFGQKTEESSGHKKYRRQIDGKVTTPTFKWLAIEKRCPKGLGSFIFRRFFIVEKERNGADLSCADVGWRQSSISHPAIDRSHELVDKNMQLSFFFFDVGFDL